MNYPCIISPCTVRHDISILTKSFWTMKSAPLVLFFRALQHPKGPLARSTHGTPCLLSIRSLRSHGYTCHALRKKKHPCAQYLDLFYIGHNPLRQISTKRDGVLSSFYYIISAAELVDLLKGKQRDSPRARLPLLSCAGQ